VAISYDLIKEVSAKLYSDSLRKIPEDTKAKLREAQAKESNDTAKNTIKVMLESAEAAEKANFFVCSDSGVPVYSVKIGSGVQFDGNVRQAFTDGFKHLCETIDPPLLQHVTNPMTLERGYEGKDMPIVTFDVLDGADHMEITCSPKALGSGRWADMEIFTFPTQEQIEDYVMKVVKAAGSQHCPPVVIGVGIGGTSDYCTKMAKEAMLRPFGQPHPEKMVAAMEQRLLEAVNKTGFGPMGTGGDNTAMAVHVNYAAGHGFTPIAVEFNCWINRRKRARLYNDGRVEYSE